MRLKLISCEVFHREMATASARSPNHIEAEFLPVRLRQDRCAGLRGRLQKAIIEAQRDRFQAVLLGFGICTDSLVGLKAGTLPLVMPRDCDCVSRWLQKGPAESRLYGLKPTPSLLTGRPTGGRSGKIIVRPSASPTRRNFRCSLRHLANRYGEDIAAYFSGEFQACSPKYRPLRFLEVHTGPNRRSGQCFQPVDRLLQPGMPPYAEGSLIQRLVDGYWSHDEFLVVLPGWEVAKSLDQRLTTVKTKE